MANYTREYSKLPYQIYEPHNYKDVDDTVAEAVNKIKALQSEGRYDDANIFINDYKQTTGNDLSKYVFSAEAFNAIEEETRNLEIYCKSKKQSIFYNEEPGYPILYDVWIS